METYVQNLSLNTSLILTGLSAGLFYAWSVSVIPGTQKLDDVSYLSTMQNINREILNPAFFLVFFGSLIVLLSSTILYYDLSSKGFWFLLMALLSYSVGTVVVTGLGNVPLNNELDRLQLTNLSTREITEFRRHYESNWNRLHSFRMVFSVFAFIMTMLALDVLSK